MALPKLFQRIFWHNNTTPAINEDNLNAMSKAIDDIDNRVIALGDDVMTVIPQIQAYLDQAEDLVEAMELLSQNPPYIGQNGNWWVWDTNTSAFVDSGVDASISVNIADITMLAPDAAPYVTNSGTDTDPIFHLFIPMGQTGNGISTIAKTGTSGLVDTYTITMTDGTTSTFTVTNGAGDMNKSVYDPTNAIANAGGMKSAAAKNSTNAVTANSTDLVESGAVYTSEQNIYEVMGQNGAKNLLLFPYSDGYNKSDNLGITYTVDDNGVVTANGTSTGDSSFYLFSSVKASELQWMNGMKFSGITDGDSKLFMAIFKHTSPYTSYCQIKTDEQIISGIPNDNTTVSCLIRVGNGKTVSNKKFYPMIRLASDTDPTYQPYAETNQQLTEKAAGLWDNMMDNGAVNVLNFNPATATQGETTFTRNSDGTYTVVATATTASPRNVSANITLPAGSYKLTGTPPNGSNICRMTVYSNTESRNLAIDEGSGSEFTITQTNQCGVYIDLRTGVPAGTYVFKPMISDPSLNLSYDDYVPYAKSNRELTEELKNRLPLLIDSGTIPANSSKTISITGSSSAMYRLTIGSIGADKCGKIVILGKHPSVADIKYATFDCDDISASYAATISVSGSSLTITSATNSNCMYTLEKIRD